MTTTAKRRLRWYQYSLRSLFVLTVLVAIAGSWFAVKRQQVERQREAVKAIRELGGWEEYDYQHPQPDPLILPTKNAQPPGPAWLRSWLGDDFFAHVTVVCLNDTKAEDAALACLNDVPHLQMLELTETQVTDAGLKQLQGLGRLQRLGLGQTQVTDAGLEHLKGLTRLESLGLIGTKVTDEGVKKLQEALPNCQIVR
jgi:hypothetical protein